MRRSSKKFQFIIVGLLLLAVSWIGYWIGYVASKPERLVTSLQDTREGHRRLLPYENEGKQKALPPMKGHNPVVYHKKVRMEEEVVVAAVDKNDVHDDAMKQARDEQLRKELLAHEAKLKAEHLKQEMALRAQYEKHKELERQQHTETPIKPWPRDKYALLHGESATQVHAEIHRRIRPLDSYIDPRAYTFHAKKLPKSVEMRPSVGNGVLATTVHSPFIYMQGVYNGRGSDSHRAAIPSTVSFNVTGSTDDITFRRNYTLNVAAGIYEELSVSKDWTLYHRLYAHRDLANLLVVEIELIRKKVSKPVILRVDLNKWRPSKDITFLKDESNMKEVSYKSGTINAPESGKNPQYVEVHVLYDHVPETLAPPVGAHRCKWVFLTAVATNKSAVFRAYKQGAELTRGNDQLFARHVTAWGDLWRRGLIYVEGNLTQSRAIFGAYYAILSSMPLRENTKWPFVGLSPGGLPTDGYKGHVFWDQDTWMYPPLLMQHVDLAEIILQARLNKMAAARSNAALNRNQGLRFPWESAFTGEEVCGDVEAKQEIHISGDVSFAFLQHLYATNDTAAVKKSHGDLFSGIARFWVSRLKSNKITRKYEILDVQPPDEYEHHVNNSAFTNSVAQTALSAPYIAMRRLNITIDHFQTYSENMYIPFDAAKNFHPEFDGFKPTKYVKQADVVLMGFPLQKKMAASTRKNDLTLYEKITKRQGPAMTWAMFSIGWKEAGRAAQADFYYNKNFRYIRNQFQVWNEIERGLGEGAPNFITGCGGFLQNVIFGYGGLRLRANRLDLDPSLPLGSTGLFLTGIDYLRSSMDLHWSRDVMIVTLRDRRKDAPTLKLYTASRDLVTLELNRALRIKRQKASIISADFVQSDEA